MVWRLETMSGTSNVLRMVVGRWREDTGSASKYLVKVVSAWRASGVVGGGESSTIGTVRGGKLLRISDMHETCIPCSEYAIRAPRMPLHRIYISGSIALNRCRYNPPNVKPCSTIWWPSKALFGRFMQPYALDIIHSSRLTWDKRIKKIRGVVNFPPGTVYR